jgi:predicted dehydrogenase
MSVVAVCDVDDQRAQSAGAEFGATAYPDAESFLRHPMDAVIVANAFDEHAPIAIKALESGLHVVSETTACRSIAEAVALVRTVERTGLVYCYGENYPYKPHARLMRRIYQDGAIGTVQYAECEYLHGFSPTYMAHFGETAGHCRLRISSLAYGTHTRLHRSCT